jgi:hypothetical protein
LDYLKPLNCQSGLRAALEELKAFVEEGVSPEDKKFDQAISRIPDSSWVYSEAHKKIIVDETLDTFLKAINNWIREQIPPPSGYAIFSTKGSRHGLRVSCGPMSNTVTILTYPGERFNHGDDANLGCKAKRGKLTGRIKLG